MKSKIFFSFLLVAAYQSQASECDDLFGELTKLLIKSTTYKDSARESDYRPQTSAASYKGHLGYVWMGEKKERAAVNFSEVAYQEQDEFETDDVAALPVGTKLIFSRFEFIIDKDWCGPNTCTCLHEKDKKTGGVSWNCLLSSDMVR